MSQRSGKRRWVTRSVAVCILLGGSALAVSQVRIGVGVAVPGLSIGINIPAYPEFTSIPGYPVYYAPGLSANLFFYDGLYWVLAGDDWYYSSWYDGPWHLAEPELVPDFILRIPILYYRRPPAYFLGWDRQAAPRWGEHWGPAWEQRRGSWDRWDRASVPPRAPLPTYQRQYPRARYPGADQQRNLENRDYPYKPREPGDRSRLEQAPQFGRGTAPQRNRLAPQDRRSEPPGTQGVSPGVIQRPAVTRPSPPSRIERSAPGTSRPEVRPGGQPSQRRDNARPQGRQDRQGGAQRRGDEERGQPPSDRPPG